jgi:hypothetical protein
LSLPRKCSHPSFAVEVPVPDGHLVVVALGLHSDDLAVRLHEVGQHQRDHPLVGADVEHPGARDEA